MMDASRWDVVKRLFEAALEHSEAERISFVETACGADVELRREVESLLAAHAEAGSFAEHPPVPMASVSGAALDVPRGDRGRLQPGARVGSYVIREFLAAGAMGEVYRAHDVQLRRDVALKVLPASFSTDPERVARFQREARLLAALNHPHIGAIYGFEEAEGVRALILELVEGETLADRLRRGPIPLDQTLLIARQIADALDAAHERGIIHRDLKPANIKVTADGTVKVLDFGLAKAWSGEGAAPDMSELPTVTATALREGVIMGTPAYMSPEQARGQAVNKRTDIWAFGCVLFEMLTGTGAFRGETVSETLAEVMKSEPRWLALPPDTPANVRHIVQRCLEKDPRQRVRDIGDVRLALEGVFELVAADTTALARGVRALGRRPLMLSLGMLLTGVAITGLAIWFLRPASSAGPQPVSRFTITFPADQPFTAGDRHLVALSPQGTHLVYQANDRLYLRAIDQLSATPIPGTEIGPVSARSPFFSPDGQWIGFWQNGELRKVALTGGALVKLWEAQSPWGASWGPDDTILYGQGPAGIWRVSGQGGTPQRVVSVDEKRGESAHGPQLLPGGRAVLFTLATGGGGAWNEAQIVVEVLESGERKVVLRGGRDARYVETGHLVYARGGTLLAVPFDLGQLAVIGGPVPLVEGVRDASNSTGATHFSLSSNGSLIYAVGDSVQAQQGRLVWVARSGAEQPLAAPPGLYENPRLSPDGRRAAVEVPEGAESAAGGGGLAGGEEQLWVYDLARDTLTRMTFEGGNNEQPVWTPDGRRIAFQSSRDGVFDKIFWQLADSSGGLERLTTGGEGNQTPRSWSADGQLLAFDELNRRTGSDIWVLQLSDRKAEPFLRTPFEEGVARFSPDGRWLAYVSNESGRPEIYVQPYPGPGGKWQVSIDGGTDPVWSRNGRELFYRTGNRMMAVETTMQPRFSAGKPRMLFEGPYFSDFATAFSIQTVSYDVSADGQRFLVVKANEAASRSAAQINVVLNWTEELKRRVPSR
jgi:eukaryotic-like serine/threonine-protein kinase